MRARAQHAANKGNWHEAEVLYLQLICCLEYLLGTSHLDVASAAHSLSYVLEKQGKIEEAVKWRERTSEMLLGSNERFQ
ncbi:MAG TPA: tetratricopeptide repeat protein [Candidatus Obscuribacterales bacterium]